MDENRGPIAVGGLGGSGTRVVAKILAHLNVYIGSDINTPADNLWFTLLFKRPHYYAKVIAAGETKPLHIAMELFESLMTGKPFTQPKYLRYMLRSFLDHLLYPVFPTRLMVAKWELARLQHLLRLPKNNLADHDFRWGWKEPNTHIFINYLADYFPSMKFILTVRHGLDMAFSTNQQQLFHWGPLYGIEPPTSDSTLPTAALEYWLRANTLAIERGTARLASNFLALNYDELCLDPPHAISKLLAFLEIDASPDTVKKLCTLPRVPSSFGRYKNFDMSTFDEEQISGVRHLGFEIEQPT